MILLVERDGGRVVKGLRAGVGGVLSCTSALGLKWAEVLLGRDVALIPYGIVGSVMFCQYLRFSA